eukprot:SAG31_NODE_3829_length_3842_cov_124.370558_2_plen_98_part_00
MYAPKNPGLIDCICGACQSVTFDQSDYPTILNFHLNGHDQPFKSITSVRGDMRPAASGASLHGLPRVRVRVRCVLMGRLLPDVLWIMVPLQSRGVLC